jgi:D-lactate dehydrogenase (cytochrome)
VRCANKQSAAVPGAPIWPEKPALFLKFQGSEQVIASDIQRTAELVRRNQGSKLAFAKDDQEKEDLWYTRKVALWSALDYCACFGELPTFESSPRAKILVPAA